MSKEHTYHLSPYLPRWTEEFAAEKKDLETVFGEAALEIAHIGSTAVEGLPSKPIIDIAVMIETQDEADGFTEALAELGYVYEPPSHPGTPERHFYTKGEPYEYHLSVAYTDVGGFWWRQILFRDYLRAHSDAREEYVRIREELLLEHPSGRGSGATEAKTEFVYRVLKAAGWRVGHLYENPRARQERRTIVGVVPRKDFTLDLTFDNGDRRSLDMTKRLTWKPFEEVATTEDFVTARAADGTIAWDCGIRMDPNYAYSLCV